MKRPSIVRPSTALMALALMAAGCSANVGTAAPASVSSTQTISSTGQTFADPFAYCAAVGTVDLPDARYAGTPIPDEIIDGFKVAAELQASTEPMDMLRKTTIWRCMGGKVYACNLGANLPCDSKGDAERTPTRAMRDYCRTNLGSDTIPMSVTGHATVYSWHCADAVPQIVEQIAQLDPAGYLAQIWYALEPSP